MKNVINFAAGCIALCLLATPASAGGQLFNDYQNPFNGCFIGGGVGITSGTLEAKDYGYKVTNGATNFIAEVGCDVPLGDKFFAGVFGSYAFGSGDGSVYGYPVGVKGAWDVGARLGYLVAERTGLYLKAGLTGVEVESLDYYNTFFVGGGVETFFNKNWSMDVSGKLTLPEKESYYGTDIEFDSFDIGAKIKYRFGS